MIFFIIIRDVLSHVNNHFLVELIFLKLSSYANGYFFVWKPDITVKTSRRFSYFTIEREVANYSISESDSATKPQWRVKLG